MKKLIKKYVFIILSFSLICVCTYSNDLASNRGNIRLKDILPYPEECDVALVLDNDFTGHLKRSGSPGIDIDFVGVETEQRHINEIPEFNIGVYSPVSGTIIVPGPGEYGTIIIRDDSNFYHKLLHHQIFEIDEIPIPFRPDNSLGTFDRKTIKKGELIGYLGNTDPQNKAMRDHVHYCIYQKDDVYGKVYFDPQEVIVDRSTGSVLKTGDSYISYIRDILIKNISWNNNDIKIQGSLSSLPKGYKSYYKSIITNLKWIYGDKSGTAATTDNWDNWSISIPHQPVLWEDIKLESYCIKNITVSEKSISPPIAYNIVISETYFSEDSNGYNALVNVCKSIDGTNVGETSQFHGRTLPNPYTKYNDENNNILINDEKLKEKFTEIGESDLNSIPSGEIYNILFYDKKKPIIASGKYNFTIKWLQYNQFSGKALLMVNDGNGIDTLNKYYRDGKWSNSLKASNIWIHKGQEEYDDANRDSIGCITIDPEEWNSFINLFPDKNEWASNNYIGKVYITRNYTHEKFPDVDACSLKLSSPKVIITEKE